MKIAIGSDHAGYELKTVLLEYLTQNGIEYKDFGTNTEESVDYPDFAHPVAKGVENKDYDFGVVVCGSGNGINMVVNKYQGIRAALCWKEEIAEMARLHNDANILSLPGRYISKEEGVKMLEIFIKTEFEGGRHLRRINKIPVES